MGPMLQNIGRGSELIPLRGKIEDIMTQAFMSIQHTFQYESLHLTANDLRNANLSTLHLC